MNFIAQFKVMSKKHGSFTRILIWEKCLESLV